MEAVLARAIQLLVALGGAYLLALWFALVVWTFQDIQRRSRSVIAQIFSTLVVVLFFIPGILIYLILRPQDTLDEAFQRSLEEEYLLQDLEELPLCPGCQHYVQEEFAFCPHCRTELRQPCVECERLIDLRWDVCPFCGTEQYPEEPAVPQIREWGQREPASIGRLVHHARERLSGRWSRVPPEVLPGETASINGMGTEAMPAISWNGDSRGSQGWTRTSPDATRGANGAAPVDESWGDDDSAVPASAADRTDEIPAAVSSQQQ
ncbi:MAG TPA: zinc ribbon domain-containing protein [Thermomicrobiaceae bacterium]|nr:zinc ribbon domain-containing protein [Thermomicrobiaceae bacterium]